MLLCRKDWSKLGSGTSIDNRINDVLDANKKIKLPDTRVWLKWGDKILIELDIYNKYTVDLQKSSASNAIILTFCSALSLKIFFLALLSL